MKRLLASIILSLLVLASALAGGQGQVAGSIQHAAAQIPAEELDQIIMIPGPVDVSISIENDVQAVLLGSGDILPAADYYSITDQRLVENWNFVSVVALVDLDTDLDWNLDDSVWAGLVLLRQDAGKGWYGAVEGTAAFSELLREVPESVLTTAAKESIDPLQRGAATEPYIFPWEEGTDMYYGYRGVHEAGFSHLIPGWKAVDFLSDGNTAVLNAPNRLLAAGAGSISYVCRGSVNVAIRIEGLLYVHLLDNSSLYVGSSFDQGDELGQLKTGSFSDHCGWAAQQPDWFHVHWGFPGTGAFEAGGWTLNLSDGLWRRGDEVQGVRAWFRAEPLEYLVQGRVTDHNLTPASGVTITHQSGLSTTTNISGNYAFTLTRGAHTLTPAYPSRVFWPPERTLETPLELVGQSFVMLAEPVTATVFPTSALTLVYTDTQGLTTTAELPAGAVVSTTMFVLAPTLAFNGGGAAFAGHAFELRAYPEGNLLPSLTFSRPVTVTVRYSELDVRVISDTGQLALNWWDAGESGEAAGTCHPASLILHDPDSRIYSVPVCRTGAYALTGPTNQSFLPLLLKN